jgi:prepilin-type N-terminal cleavage/methylation domain-containing protein
MTRLSQDKKGFTIIELMIATAVFSVVLLVCAYGLLEIGRTYYRGVTASRTQETARRILDDVSESIKFNGGTVATNEAGGVHCIGIKRYSFELNRMFTDSSANHALVSDEASDFGGSCGPGVPRQGLSGGALTGSSAELLSDRMRISQFSITELIADTGLYRVTVRVVTGEDDLLVDRNSDNIINGADNPIECKNDRAGSQFCAVSELTTTVQKRI